MKSLVAHGCSIVIMTVVAFAVAINSSYPEFFRIQGKAEIAQTKLLRNRLKKNLHVLESISKSIPRHQAQLNNIILGNQKIIDVDDVLLKSNENETNTEECKQILHSKLKSFLEDAKVSLTQNLNEQIVNMKARINDSLKGLKVFLDFLVKNLEILVGECVERDFSCKLMVDFPQDLRNENEFAQNAEFQVITLVNNSLKLFSDEKISDTIAEEIVDHVNECLGLEI